jgi:MFS family permease
MLHNTLQAQATELAPRARGSTFALFSAAMFLGQGIGPIFAGTISKLLGFQELFRIGRNARGRARNPCRAASEAPHLRKY